MTNHWLDKNLTTLSMRYQCDIITAIETTERRRENTRVMMKCCRSWVCSNGIREKVDRKLVRTKIGTKRKLGWGIEWSNEHADELHKSIRKKFKKRRVFASGTDAIWTADLIDIQCFPRSNKVFKYILMIIDVFCKYGWAMPLKTKTGPEVMKAFRSLWRKQAPPQTLWPD